MSNDIDVYQKLAEALGIGRREAKQMVLRTLYSEEELSNTSYGDKKYENRPDQELMHVVRVSGGKYTFHSYLGCVVDVSRYGQEWIHNLNGPNAINSIMYELDAARFVLDGVRRLVSTMDGRSKTKDILEKLIERHDRLTDDHEPPSEWTK